MVRATVGLKQLKVAEEVAALRGKSVEETAKAGQSNGELTNPIETQL